MSGACVLDLGNTTVVVERCISIRAADDEPCVMLFNGEPLPPQEMYCTPLKLDTCQV